MEDNEGWVRNGSEWRFFLDGEVRAIVSGVRRHKRIRIDSGSGWSEVDQEFLTTMGAKIAAITRLGFRMGSHT